LELPLIVPDGDLSGGTIKLTQDCIVADCDYFIDIETLGILSIVIRRY
jgi:hypothetical protein